MHVIHFYCMNTAVQEPLWWIWISLPDNKANKVIESGQSHTMELLEKEKVMEKDISEEDRFYLQILVMLYMLRNKESKISKTLELCYNKLEVSHSISCVQGCIEIIKSRQKELANEYSSEMILNWINTYSAKFEKIWLDPKMKWHRWDIYLIMIHLDDDV